MSVVGVVSEWWVVSRWEMNDKVRYHQQSDLLQGWRNETGSWTKYFLRYFEGRASGLYGWHRQRKLICSDLWKTTRLNTENSSRKWKCNNRLTLATGIVIICFITSAMEVLFSLAFVFCSFVCLFVCLFYCAKTYSTDSHRFRWKGAHGPRKKPLQGAPWSWKVMEFRKTNFQAWKVMENSNGHRKSWKSHGKWW